ncbi:MAG: DNA photolyase family protein, partial [Bdellovibrionaceae bacterium]|nr:DNA photolyase family protein [Pseudobdellovibrionaceae bacterium]
MSKFSQPSYKVNKEPINLFWFRRDLRLHDNAGLFEALKSTRPVLPIFIFDTLILEKLEDKKDKRVQFIYESVLSLKADLNKLGSDLLIYHGTPLEIFSHLLKTFSIQKVYANHDYEPQAKERDNKVSELLRAHNCQLLTFKDQVIFEKTEIVAENGNPYTVYTPYKNKWLQSLSDFYLKSYPTKNYQHLFFKTKDISVTPSLADLGFISESWIYPAEELNSNTLIKYAQNRDYPAIKNGTSLLGLHLRFGTVSVRELAREGKKLSSVWLSELIWRDFFMQVLWHHPQVVKQSFKAKYERISWRKSPDDFQAWQEGKTGYPLVDAGMRELNSTGHMHNRVRMVVASFLTKHLLIHWLEGERYFAKKLLDYDLAANNGNWQWAAGTGCDAAP